MIQTVVTTQAVSAGELRRFPHEDLLGKAEVQVLRELVIKVHEDGFVGLTWPTVSRQSVWKNLLDEWEACDPEDAEQWFVRAEVEASPR